MMVSVVHFCKMDEQEKNWQSISRFSRWMRQRLMCYVLSYITESAVEHFRSIDFTAHRITSPVPWSDPVYNGQMVMLWYFNVSAGHLNHAHTSSYCNAQLVKGSCCITLVVMQLIYICVSLTHKTAAVSFIT